MCQCTGACELQSLMPNKCCTYSIGFGVMHGTAHQSLDTVVLFSPLP